MNFPEDDQRSPGPGAPGTYSYGAEELAERVLRIDASQTVGTARGTSRVREPLQGTYRLAGQQIPHARTTTEAKARQQSSHARTTTRSKTWAYATPTSPRHSSTSATRWPWFAMALLLLVLLGLWFGRQPDHIEPQSVDRSASQGDGGGNSSRSEDGGNGSGDSGAWNAHEEDEDSPSATIRLKVVGDFGGVDRTAKGDEVSLRDAGTEAPVTLEQVRAWARLSDAGERPHVTVVVTKTRSDGKSVVHQVQAEIITIEFTDSPDARPLDGVNLELKGSGQSADQVVHIRGELVDSPEETVGRVTGYATRELAKQGRAGRPPPSEIRILVRRVQDVELEGESDLAVAEADTTGFLGKSAAGLGETPSDRVSELFKRLRAQGIESDPMQELMSERYGASSGLFGRAPVSHPLDWRTATIGEMRWWQGNLWTYVGDSPVGGGVWQQESG